MFGTIATPPKGGGHASMEVGSTYISWWPRPDGRTKNGLRLLPQIYAAHPYRDQDLGDDEAYEERGPDQTVCLNNLNENAIKDWWQSFGLRRDGVVFEGPLQAWRTLKMNCSTVVAIGLTIGGGASFRIYKVVAVDQATERCPGICLDYPGGRWDGRECAMSPTREGAPSTRGNVSGSTGRHFPTRQRSQSAVRRKPIVRPHRVVFQERRGAVQCETVALAIAAR